ncbi:multisubunit potassium/proton antiporter, PhaA subunit /multisubunit potassium/proton antiporter, PhaB subunit [Nitrosospira sp. Nl5]|uniref:monovalent cation/H+ antiporter subunit A n=1 Tax=Nitrosospira sp. Nl5 TaxID=200120 RepID=UPI000883CEF1|nr:monovalent cation/H+ antiporter subunit A [Nitrosospira sp. Nl5]SCX96429.1 multisubunit potassium/proton antiporter, PhaA subunit /multisubunit potassium/proton antiporter, PhaB subunit [Nitrosospira sp. Nl5]
MSLTWIVILPFAGSLCAAFLPSHARNTAAWLAGGVALACVALTFQFYPQMMGGAVVRDVVQWAPSLGLDFTFRMDGFAWLFAMLVTVMGALVILYARYYMAPQDPVPRFFSFFLAFMGAMLGVVLSGNLIQLVVFWELTSLTSFMLIAYWYHRADARRGARMALTVTAGGGLCLLAGVLILGRIVGSYDLDAVLASGELVRAHSWYLPALILIALGALTKSAQFPFHFWLPHAMAAPTPVSVYLHSATMVKAGVFLLVRLWPVLAGTDAWFWIIGSAGLSSLVLGAYMAIFQRDMKGVLAYSTISHLGLITLLLGLNSALALIAAIFHIVNHATFKASLFMAAGMVDHETGTRDLSRLSGLYRAMPLTATLATVGAAAMAGVPLLNGFISKEMFFTETIFISGNLITRLGLPAMAVIWGIFSVAYSLRFILQVFFGPSARDLPRNPHEPPRWMLLPSALLVAACLVVGMVPAKTIEPYLDVASLSVLGADMPLHSLAVWHGVSLPLIMSLLAMAGGVLLYRALGKYQQGTAVVPLVDRFHLDGKRIFEFLLEKLDVSARGLTQWLSTERLQVQLLLLICAAFASALIPLSHGGLPEGDMSVAAIDPAFAMMWLVGAVCAIAAAAQAKYHRLAALSLSGAAGLATCMTFVWFSAPDLALTQLVVEVVTLVLILLGLRWLPPRYKSIDDDARSLGARIRARSRRLRDLGLAIVAGAGMTILSFAVLTRQAGEGISPFFIENSLLLAGGANVINVILVDFRGFDTLGEITVLGIVALTVFALLRRFRPAPESMGLTPQQQEQDAQTGRSPPDPHALLPVGPMMLPAVIVQLLLPVAGMVAVFFLLRGHNEPGGGFVAGLIVTTAVILQYLVGGTAWAESRTRIHPQYWIALGLLCAAGAGVSAWLAPRQFLSALTWHTTLPVIGELHLSTVLLFDLGVFLLVVGAAVLILVALAHQSRRGHRKAAPTHVEPKYEVAPGEMPSTPATAYALVQPNKGD